MLNILNHQLDPDKPDMKKLAKGLAEDFLVLVGSILIIGVIAEIISWIW